MSKHTDPLAAAFAEGERAAAAPRMSERLRAGGEGVLAYMAGLLRCDAPDDDATIELAGRAVEKYGLRRMERYVAQEVIRLGHDPDKRGWLTPAQLFRTDRLAQRLMVAEMQPPNAPNPDEVDRVVRGGTTRCAALDDVLPLLRRMLRTDRWQALVAWDEKDLENGWNAVKLRAVVRDGAGKLITEDEQRERGTRIGRLAAAGRLDDALRVAGGMEDRTIELRPVSPHHRAELESWGCRAIQSALDQANAPEKAPRVRLP